MESSPTQNLLLLRGRYWVSEGSRCVCPMPQSLWLHLLWTPFLSGGTSCQVLDVTDYVSFCQTSGFVIEVHLPTISIGSLAGICGKLLPKPPSGAKGKGKSDHSRIKELEEQQNVRSFTSNPSSLDQSCKVRANSYPDHLGLEP